MIKMPKNNQITICMDYSDKRAVKTLEMFRILQIPLSATPASGVVMEMRYKGRTYFGLPEIKSLANSLRHHVSLGYSCDDIRIGEEDDVITALYQGRDQTTSVLSHLNVPYTIQLESDFHFAEPILTKVTKKGIDGKVYEIFNEMGRGGFCPIDGSYNVLVTLLGLGVIPFTEIPEHES